MSFLDNAIGRALDLTNSITGFASSPKGYAMIAGFAQQQTALMTNPTLQNARAWGRQYGPLLVSAAVPGGGWVALAYYVYVVLDERKYKLQEIVEDFARAQWPATGYVIDAVHARGQGLRGMLIATAIAQLPENVRALAAIAVRAVDDPRDALGDLAVQWLPEEPAEVRQLARAAFDGKLRETAIDLAISRLPASPPEVRQLARAQLAGDAKDTAIQLALDRLPKEAALAVRLAQDPKGQAASLLLDQVPPDVGSFIQLARSGKLTAGLIDGVLASVHASPKAHIVALGLALDVAHGRTGAQWRAFREQFQDAIHLPSQNLESKLGEAPWNFKPALSVGKTFDEFSKERESLAPEVRFNAHYYEIFHEQQAAIRAEWLRRQSEIIDSARAALLLAQQEDLAAAEARALALIVPVPTTPPPVDAPVTPPRPVTPGPVGHGPVPPAVATAPDEAEHHGRLVACVAALLILPLAFLFLPRGQP